MAGAAGAKTIIAGFLRVNGQLAKRIDKALGLPHSILDYFNQPIKDSYYRFSLAEKREYYQRAKIRANHGGMDFTVCYDHADDYLAMRDLWANPNDCCNGLGKLPAWRYTYALRP